MNCCYSVLVNKQKLKSDSVHTKAPKILKKANSATGEIGVERVIEEHLSRSLSLSLAFLRQNREIRAPLDPTLLVPHALPVPHQNHSSQPES
ncbi:hypothetical protein ACOSP7_026710 [Xanthoceras sorbifolium]